MKLFSAIRTRVSQGTQYIPDLRLARPKGFRGLPFIDATPCKPGCRACADLCPTLAVSLDPVSIDLGRCIFCKECEESCPSGKIRFSNDPKMGAAKRDGLILKEGVGMPTLNQSESLAKIFGRSLKLRQVSAGGCNACELELNATANVNFDLQRFGIEWVASPRHADALVLTGPLTRNMREAIRFAWDAMPDPRFLVAVGACAISGGLFEGASGVDRDFLESVGPSLYVPGCPPHPLTFANAVLDFLMTGRK